MKLHVKLRYASIDTVCANLLEVKQYVADLINDGHEVLNYTYEYKSKPTTVSYEE